MLKDIQIKGNLIFPGDKNYDENRVTWNKDVSGTPALIAQVKDYEDVVTIIKYASANKTLLGVASGRHSALCMVDNALVIDFSLMKKIEFNQDHSQVTAQSGVKMGEIDTACKPFGVAIVGGTNPDTGIAGLTLGGGIGHLARKFGMAIDNLIRLKMVLATGEIITVDDQNHSDLFWGMKGAGANFGVVLEFTYQTHRIPSNISLGSFKYRCIPILSGLIFEHPKTALKKSIAFSQSKNMSNDVACSILLMSGGTVIDLFADISENSIQNIRKIRKECGYTPFKSIQYTDYHSGLQTVVEKDQKTGYYYEKGALFADLPPQIADILMKHVTQNKPNHLCSILITRLGGSIKSGVIKSSAFANRTASWWIVFMGKWEHPDEREKVVKWVRGVYMETRSFHLGQYAPVIGVKTTVEEFQQGEGHDCFFDLTRLQGLKKRYDPENLFHLNRNIKPQ